VIVVSDARRHRIGDHLSVLVARVSVAILALVASAWFALGFRQAHDLSAAESIVASGSITSHQASRVNGLLNSAATLNPDQQVKLTRAQLAFDSGDGQRAIKLTDQVTKAEPENLLAWDELAKVSGGDTHLLLIAFRHLRQLHPPTRPRR
jgi:hypothetical protein